MVKPTTVIGAASGRGADSPDFRIDALGKSEMFLDFQQRLARTAKVQRPVLLIGERGTGKELAAARIHFLSRRWGGPFVKLNCAALSPSVLESELFGHEVGAFTGAARRRVGRFEAAHGGTLFLDEIGQMPMPVQEKILRAVEYGSFERVGASESVQVDVRLVGATNADLPLMVAKGEFKADLLDRLSFEVVAVPSLRERGEGDIELLARHFASRMSAELGAAASPEFTASARSALYAYPWPGNVRELKNVVERAVCRADDDRPIDEIVFDPFCAVTLPPKPEAGRSGRTPGEAANASEPSRRLPVNLPDILAATERALLEQALTQSRFRQREAAVLLGLSYDQFRGLYRKHQDISAKPEETIRSEEAAKET